MVESRDYSWVHFLFKCTGFPSYVRLINGLVYWSSMEHVKVSPKKQADFVREWLSWPNVSQQSISRLFKMHWEKQGNLLRQMLRGEGKSHSFLLVILMVAVPGRCICSVTKLSESRCPSQQKNCHFLWYYYIYHFSSKDPRLEYVGVSYSVITTIPWGWLLYLRNSEFLRAIQKRIHWSLEEHPMAHRIEQTSLSISKEMKPSLCVHRNLFHPSCSAIA